MRDPVVPLLLVLAVAAATGVIASKWKRRGFTLWALISCLLGLIFPGLSLGGVVLLSFMPKGHD